MQNISNVNIENCFGCKACGAKCPQKAISFVYNSKGFIFPKVDDHLCADCRLCVKICPALHRKTDTSNDIGYYACYAKDKGTVENSSSGGVFSLLAKAFVEGGGIVCGAVFSKDFSKVEHVMARDAKGINELQRSKYLQSDMSAIYTEITAQMAQGKSILFAGTPCQCQAVKNFFAEKHDNLYLVDFLCHGVPSPKMWSAYKANLEKHYHSKVIGVNFRDKRSGWRKFGLSLSFENGLEYYASVQDDPYLQCFLMNFNLRTTCYSCQFRGEKRISDITLSDYWNAGQEMRGFGTEGGISYICMNSDKGRALMNGIWNSIESKEARKDYITHEGIPNPMYPRKYEKARIDFDGDVYSLLKKVCHKNILMRMKGKLHLRNRLKKLIMHLK